MSEYQHSFFQAARTSRVSFYILVMHSSGDPLCSTGNIVKFDAPQLMNMLL